MRDVHPREVQIYQTVGGREPFTERLKSIQDISTQDRIQTRLVQLKYGNFGDYRSVGGGVFELRLHFGAGYRIYFGQMGAAIVLLLCGGGKSSQTRDIERAKTYWLQYKGKNL